ncbi:MAG: diguanylate cyclase, partial [Rhodospirillaceae bacterium]|nr:diguanylate cyclase [Rhodospirillaceae bacterium]
WAEMAWLGIVAAPLLWMMFVWTYCRRETGRHTPLIRSLIWGLSLTVWAVALSNDHHHLIYRTATPIGPNLGTPILYDHGPLFIAITVPIYLCMLFSLGITITTARDASVIHRRHSFGFVVAVLIPLLGNLSYVTGQFYLFGFDPTPFCFLLTGAVFFWLVERRQLFSLLPIALRPLLNSLPDAILVLDDADRVVETNPAAQMLTIPAPQIGHLLPDVMAAVLNPLLAYPDPDKVSEIHLNPDDRRCHEVRIRWLSHKTHRMGRVVVLRDITHRKEIERCLTEQLTANMKLQEQLRNQANRDPLTGLCNRNFLESVRDTLLTETRLGHESLAVAMIDLDHFKNLNDTWGHMMGDAVLRATAHFLETQARDDDLIIRIGGEEILILLPHTTAEQAEAGIERWRAAYCAQPMILRGQSIPVSFSVGIASFPDNASTWDLLLSRADEALYQAKNAGRNRVCLWQNTPAK